MRKNKRVNYSLRCVEKLPARGNEAGYAEMFRGHAYLSFMTAYLTII